MTEQDYTALEGRKPYKTDVTDEQWDLVKDWIPPAVPKPGREPTDLREILNTILYQNRTGCQWDMLPHDLSARSTTFDYYSAWQRDGTWEAILDTLRGLVRRSTPKPVPAPSPSGEGQEPAADQTPAPAAPSGEGQEPAADQAAADQPVAPPPAMREETPSFVIMDSQSAKTTEVGGEERGYDGGKKVKGRKRHIAVDTLGLLVAVTVTAANVSDGRGACELLGRMPGDKFPRLRGACGDGRYNDRRFIAALNRRGMTLEVKTRPAGSKGFVLIKRRWVVERTFAWLGFNRRLSKDYERGVSSSETRVRIAAIGMMMRRLTRKAA